MLFGPFLALTRHWGGVLMLLAMFSSHAVIAAPQDIVVMIDARHSSGAGPAFGAGLVVGQTADRTVIVTARHVVANDAGDLAADIKVEFSTRRGRYFAATASPYYTDRELDLAVLLVEHDRTGVPPEVLTDDSRRMLSPTPPDQLVGAEVLLVGAMNRERWARGPQGDTVVGGTAQQLRVRSVEAAAGASGGGIFDSFGRLLGIASRIDSASGELIVLPMDQALARLKRWGMETTLETSPAASTDTGLIAQMRDGLRFEITYTEPDPKVSGGLWPESVGSGQGFRHRLQAVLSPALEGLNPVVRLTFPDNPQLEAIELKAPTYGLDALQYPVVLEAQAVLVLPNRRVIGPVPALLDFAAEPQAAARRLGHDAPDAVVRSRSVFEFEKRESEAARQRAGEAMRGFAVSNASNIEAGMRDNYHKVFPYWRLRCERRDEKWSCNTSSHVPRHPYGAKLENVIHGLKLGASERDLAISFPIDPAVDLGLAFPKEAAALLDDGAKQLFVWMRLATGEALGPHRLCEVKTKRRGTQTVCE